MALRATSYVIGAMPLNVAGQRCVSEREPELGLGVVVDADRARVSVKFPATGEQRIYAADTPVLKRVQFRPGETVRTRAGGELVVAVVEERDGLLVYVGAEGRRVREDELSDVTSVALPQERLMTGQTDPGEVFDLRRRALEAQWRLRQSTVRGFLGGRVDLIPHQLYILHEVASRQNPRVLLADEVGLGKTIEACLIVQRLLAVGRATRVLVLVPESLVHQWFVELLRRFNLWFGIYDEERCIAAEGTDGAANPFLDTQLVLGSVAFLAGSEVRREQAIAAGWDMVVVDEAHHLAWTPDAVSTEYALVERLAQKSPGLLLLTATPTQLGMQGHFARLRLLDPDRYRDFETFLAEAEEFGAVAGVIEKITEEKPLKPADHKALARIFRRDPEGLGHHLEALKNGAPGAREALIRTLLDQHGPGRVMFRNTRAAMTGFPKRKYCPAALAGGDATLRARIAREFEAEELGHESAIRHSFKDDPRVEWLATFLQKHRQAKVLLICRSQRKVEAVKTALLERVNVKAGVFHEGLPLVQRDRQAAWFAEPEGAQLLLCSEIGSEGRNFQFAHHLVLFDLPLNPGLIEQRIGRLDRIGQTETIRVHVPFVEGSTDASVADWYHRGLDAFETPLHGGDEFRDRFRERLLTLATAAGTGKSDAAAFAALLEETVAFRREQVVRMKKGRDRLLELNSFNRAVAERVVTAIRAVDADPSLHELLADLFDHFGVQVREHDGGDRFLDPSHAFMEGYPSIPAEGMLATFDRRRALAREDVAFVSADHPVVGDSLDLLINGAAGTSAFAQLEADEPNLLLEAVFVLEAVADSRWHVDQFLAPMPIRVVVDVRGEDVTSEHEPARLAADIVDGDMHRFLDRGVFTAQVLKTLVDGATDIAGKRTDEAKHAARRQAEKALGADLQRLVDLRKVNDHIRPEEIELTQEQLERTVAAITDARLRLDAVRLIVAGEVA